MSDIKQKTKIGMLWNTLEKIVVQLISFVLNIILARLLTPHDYGIVGMLAIFLTFSNVFVDSGFSRALIQKQNRSESDFSTVLIFNFVVSCLLYIILFFSSPSIARFYRTPELLSLERVFFLVIILNSLSVVQNAQLQIKVDFKRIALINSLSTIFSGILGVFCAYKGLGAWALVIQTLSKSGFSSMFFWIIGRWIPKTGFSWKSFKQLFSFGSKLLLSGLLGTTINSVNNFVIGKYYNPASLGYYTRAQQFPELVSGTINSVIGGVTFPLLSELQNNTEELIQTTKKLVKITAMIVFPAMVGLSVLSKPIILVLLGEKWMDSAFLLSWLALSYLFIPLSTINLNILNAIGRSDLFLKVDFVKIPIIIITMIITFPISLKAVVIGKAITAFIYFYINSFMIGKLYNFGALRQMLSLWKYVISTIIMAILVFAVSYFLNTNVFSLIISILVGIIVYIVMLLVLRDDEFLYLFNKLFVFKNK